MSTSRPPGEITVWDTSVVRYFALVSRRDILAEAGGGMVLVPRQVWDPEENPSLPDQLLSELGMTIRYFSRRSGESDAQDSCTKLINLRLRKDISIVDLEDSEL